MNKIFCDQFCGTAIHFINGIPHNDRNGKQHKCHITEIVREFEGYYNMIQIRRVRERQNGITAALENLRWQIAELEKVLNWQEDQNKPLAAAFEERKQKGRARNYYSPHE